MAVKEPNWIFDNLTVVPLGKGNKNISKKNIANNIRKLGEYNDLSARSNF